MLTDLIANERIRAKTVRLVEDEKMIGVVPLHDALMRARLSGLDLVVVSEDDIPVCRILDADRYRYERKKTERENARRQREMTVETKELQLRPVTNANDLIVKAKQARRFLDDGDKVKVTVRFKGRERTHKDQARGVIDRFLQEIGDHKVEKPMTDEGDMIMVLAPIASKAELRRQQEQEKPPACETPL